MADNTLFNQIEKKYGKGSIRKLGDDSTVDVDVISTQCEPLDNALGIGGVPRGRIVEIYGPESSGKTTLTMHIMAECQKIGMEAAIVDAEHAFDPTYATNLGINTDDLTISQPDSGEQALGIVQMLTASGKYGVVVVDSVSALVPKAELEGEIGDAHVGLQARLMSQSMRMLTPLVKNTNTCIIFINQIREKVGVKFGSPETTSGGRALRFYASVRMDIRRIGSFKQGGEDIGNETRVKVKKNKLASPFKKAEFKIIFGKGIDSSYDDLEKAINAGIIRKAGAWYKYNKEAIAQGEANAAEWIKENPQIFENYERDLEKN